MKLFRADLHIHTVLSPCGDLEMSPRQIVSVAKERNLDIIGITDHNTTKHCALTRKLGMEIGVFVLMGAEVTTKEEAHCLTFFETEAQLADFEIYLQTYLPEIPNDTDKFGYQIQVDAEEMIVYEEPKFLPSALNQNLEQVEKKVHALHGLFIPAHINKSKFSIPAQLGFIPFDLLIDAVEISRHTTQSAYISDNKYLAGKTFIQNSDAHCIEQIAETYCFLDMEEPSFSEIKRALANQQGRRVILKETDTAAT
jgi:PHP family Zn ribbon phosphoesterase